MRQEYIFFGITVIVLIFSGALLTKRISARYDSSFNLSKAIQEQAAAAQSSLTQLFSDPDTETNDYDSQEDQSAQSTADTSDANQRPTANQASDSAQGVTETQPDQSPAPNSKATDQALPSPSLNPSPQVAQPTPLPTCRRFLITHLDGSTSNLCYSAADYNQLQNLAAQLNSAQHFAQFHQRGVDRYQDMYDDSGNDIWLDARDSAQRSLDQEQAKIGPLQLQMYEIESRGY